MGSTLLVESHPIIVKILQLNLHVYVGDQVICQANLIQAIEFLKKNHHKVEMIISRAKIEGQSVAKEIFNTLDTLGKNIPMVVIGHEPLLADKTFYLRNGLDIRFVINSVAKAKGITARDMVKQKVPYYFPIPTSYFQQIHSIPYELFVEGDNNSEGQKEYQQLYAANAEIEQEKINQLMRSGINSLYIQRGERINLTDFLSNQWIAQIDLSQLEPNEAVTATQKTQEVLGRRLHEIGITPETVQLAKKTLKSAVFIAKKSPNLSRLLNNLLKNKASFRFKRTQVLTYLGLHLMKHIDWGSVEQQSKFAFVSLFHDISLTNDEQARITSQEELDFSHLSPKDKELVGMHANLSANLIQAFPQAPMGSDIIIRQHHGMLNGIGFANHYTANLSPFSIVFIIAEEYANKLLLNENEIPTKPEIMSHLRSRFNTARFKKILDILDTVQIDDTNS